ncbi:hypothetical protein NMY22_g2511 [Coprinellus aureogranulatus]|nr:hypothetical protein NMY22_g2511 [Coprinellus aureogranulatus]
MASTGTQAPPTGNPYIQMTGPLLMGSLVSFFLNGAFCHADLRFFVYLVCVVVVEEILHMVFSTHTTYAILAEGFADPTVLVNSPFSGAALPALNGTVGFCTQIFFAWRVLILTKSVFGKIAAGVIALTAGMQCAAAYGVTVQFTMLARDIALLRTLERTVITWLAGSFTCDIIISITMVIVLYLARGSTSYTSSKSVLNALIVHTIENGLITTACALVDLLTYLKIPNTFYYVCFEYILGRLYANVLLATLNGRQRMRQTATSQGEFSFNSTGKSSTNQAQVQLSNLRSYPNHQSHQSSKTYPVVSVTTDVQVDDDTMMAKSKLSDGEMYP